MGKATWRKISGTWKQIDYIWRKTSGTWTSGTTPWIKISGTWKDCWVEPGPTLYYYLAEQYTCSGGTCGTYVGDLYIANESSYDITGYWYGDGGLNAYRIISSTTAQSPAMQVNWGWQGGSSCNDACLEA